MSYRPSLTASELDRIRTAAIDARRAYEQGGDVEDETTVMLTRWVETLVDEVDYLVWRATVAAMALDGRIQHDEVRLG